MKIYIVIILLLFCSIAIGQLNMAWEARYNGPGNGSDTPNDMAVDTDGYIYVAGTSYGSDGYEDYATIKYNPDGDTIWVSRYSGLPNSSDEAHAIAVDAGGNVYVTGQSKGPSGDYDCTTIKYNSDGVMQWDARYNGAANGLDCGEALVVDGAGNVFVTGCVYIGSTTDYDYITIKYNADGDTVWTAQYSGPGDSGGDFAFDIALDLEGNVCVTGKSEGVGNADNDFMTIKYNSAGQELWGSRYNGAGNGVDVAQALRIDNQGNVYVTGNSYGGSLNDYDCLTVKYYPNGTRPWAARYNGPASEADAGYALELDDFGNIYVCGYSYGSGTEADYLVLKYTPEAGNPWTANYNGPGNSGDYAQGLAVDLSGNVYVGGYSASAPYSYDFALVQFDLNGDSVWAERYNGPGNGSEMNISLAADGDYNIFLTGKSPGDGTGNDFVTIKYSPRTDIPGDQASGALPADVHLGCYPNPFNASVRISYSVKEPARIVLDVYNLNGQLVEKLVDNYHWPGKYSVIWDGSKVAAGVYFYKLDIAGQNLVKPMTLLK